MTWFLSIFVLVYLGFHALVYARFRVLLPHIQGLRPGLWLFFLFMIATPIIGRSLDRGGHPELSHPLTVIGYIWMGIILVALSASVLGWLVQIVIRAAGFVIPGWSVPDLPRIMAGFSLILAAAMSVYGFFEARSLRVEHVVIETAKLPPGTDRIRIAQVTDLHLGSMNGQEQIRKVVDLVRAEHPDLLVATGDMVDGNRMPGNGVPHVWAEIEAPLGKYAVIGNHEVYAHLDRSVQWLEHMGFDVVRNETRDLEQGMQLVGVDDPAAQTLTGESGLLKKLDPDQFRLLLKHRPAIAEESLGLFDLQLSGHTHGGQIYPYFYLVKSRFPLIKGLHHLAKGSILYTSRGSGTWGPPIRILSPPEVTMIDLVRKK